MNLSHADARRFVNAMAMPLTGIRPLLADFDCRAVAAVGTELGLDLLLALQGQVNRR